MKLLDLFCGRWGWSRAFAVRGWECYGLDLVEPPKPEVDDWRGAWKLEFSKMDILNLNHSDVLRFDFICASPPCEEFSVHGMKHFHPNPKYPENGIRLFNHTRSILEASGIPYVMENVKAAQRFVGSASNHCGPFYLWGSGVPPLMPQGIVKTPGQKDGATVRRMSPEEKSEYRAQFPRIFPEAGLTRAERTALTATIPPELANCVAEYAERICKARVF